MHRAPTTNGLRRRADSGQFYIRLGCSIWASRRAFRKGEGATERATLTHRNIWEKNLAPKADLRTDGNPFMRTNHYALPSACIDSTMREQGQSATISIECSAIPYRFPTPAETARRTHGSSHSQQRSRPNGASERCQRKNQCSL